MNVTDAMIDAAARSIHEAFVQQQPRPDDWPTWGELLAQGHQGARRVEDTRALALAALTAALAVSGYGEVVEALRKMVKTAEEVIAEGESFFDFGEDHGGSIDEARAALARVTPDPQS